MVIEGEYLTFLFVRPGAGAWTATFDDGDPAEPEASADGRVTAALDELTPIGGSPEAPLHLRSGDVVAVINPMRLAGALTYS